MINKGRLLSRYAIDFSFFFAVVVEGRELVSSVVIREKGFRQFLFLFFFSSSVFGNYKVSAEGCLFVKISLVGNYVLHICMVNDVSCMMMMMGYACNMYIYAC